MAKRSSANPVIADWQPPAGKSASRFSSARLDPATKPWSYGDKESDKAAVDALAIELDSLQDLFYAYQRFKLLVVLQGTDTSGKDGTVRGVFSRTSPLGVHTLGWKAPNEEERARDFLWRIHKAMPGAGETMIFNRSHYEDVLVPVVNQWADYQKAYEAFLLITSTPNAPWTVVPANSKTHRNLMIATVVRDILKKLKLRYPPSDPGLKGLVIA